MKNFSPTLFLLLALPLLLTGCFDEKSEISEKSNMEKHRGEERGERKHLEKQTPEATPIQSETPTATPSAPSTEENAAEPKTEAAAQTSSKTISYMSPGGKDEIVISLSLADGKIVSVSGEDTKVNPESAEYNERFYSAISAKVSGKTLEEAKNIGIVAGASLTSKAFSDALSNW